MLTEEERKEIEVHIEKMPKRQAACLEAMNVLQKYRGWISDESLRELAEFLDMSPHELDSVATFYNLIFRRPVGRHVILVCDSISCWIMGNEKLEAHLKRKLNIDWGETTADKRFTLLPTVCLGTCDHAPALMVDEDLHRGLEAGQLDDILEQYK
ncbi:MAG: NADH-quinone oxidoreductase subunit NuoE [Phaeodactylibacter sp.]|nr:NADH-quinone oxidoreductase subunit NuoE [Phaeodactylibacter sp.]MCB9263812.1 NADH-quinone oxidoreductase subunit NuoE [Lewinellaceae bacterium]MCB9288267.1 NADH-quinone oxidoreductase subunit NuoE [Lewinellaceae bacterium]